ncbi:unnamed protein product [Rodentolepis nana]|uniref:Sm domain-containing protein n=1 Tax=Rodentolepis nana TaxID=102285 RepID=A0A0R3SZX5_RODNA|nr:unnamed protein product [Rodentolepis nana]
MSWSRGADKRSREAAEKQLAERFLNADKRLKSSLLSIIPATLSNKVVCITLINGTKVTGTLAEIDGFNNITLRDGVRIDPPPRKKTLVPLVGLELIPAAKYFLPRYLTASHSTALQMEFNTNFTFKYLHSHRHKEAK